MESGKWKVNAMSHVKIRKNKLLLTLLAMVVLLGSMFWGDAAMTVRAASGGIFIIEAELLSSDSETYDIRVTIENLGGDWEGTARLMAYESYHRPSAYDTALSLPQGSRKQFVVKMPVKSIEDTNGTVIVDLIDGEGTVVEEKEFRHLLTGQFDALSMGILSDSYSALTFLDMGGIEIYFYNDLYPIRLVDLRQGDLTDALNNLTFLVIDQYNTGILTQEELEAIEDWNYNGGVLIIGTGAYAEDTLRGFAGGYLGIGCSGIFPPEGTLGSSMPEDGISENTAPDNEGSGDDGSEGDGTGNDENDGLGDGESEGDDAENGEPESGKSEDDNSEYGDSTSFTPATDTFIYDTGEYVDWSKLTMAELWGIDTRFSEYYTKSSAESMGNGSICTLPYSLVELVEVADFGYDFTQEDFVGQILENASGYASSRYTSTSYYDNISWYVQWMLGVMGNSNSILNFGLLKVIVVLYVIFVGPVLYLILRVAKRRELYWVAVPVTAFLGIGLVFLAGRGFEVVSTKVYSVTVMDSAGDGKARTYLHCYDADREEWSLRLAEDYEYAGSLGNSSYYNYTYYYNGFSSYYSTSSYFSADPSPYYYHVRKEGDIISLGMKPSSNFEDGYFYAGGSGNSNGFGSSGKVEGSLFLRDMQASWNNISGTVVNDTDYDISYFAVISTIWDDSLCVYEGLPAGASRDLDNMAPIYAASDFYPYIYSFLRDFYDDGDYRKASALSALGVGICDVYLQSEQDGVIVIGVVENWEKAVDDECSEISYGCLYSVQ